MLPLKYTVFVSPEGTYSSLLFPGEYKLTISNSTVPFRWTQTATGKPDSLSISMTASKTMDIEVTPYYMVRDSKITSSSGSVSSIFNVEKVINDANAKTINKVVLFINKTQFVSNNDNISSKEIVGSALTNLTNISLNVTVPTIMPKQSYVFARVGLQIGGLNSWIFSPVQKLNL